jgi:hypothetical protein
MLAILTSPRGDETAVVEILKVSESPVLTTSTSVLDARCRPDGRTAHAAHQPYLVRRLS